MSNQALLIEGTTKMDDEKYLGYLKYSGELVDRGFFDARKSAQALIGFDEAIRFFVGEQTPELKQADFEFSQDLGKPYLQKTVHVFLF